jgi:hypothetical protein
MNNPDNISQSLETIFWVKMPKFFDGDPGWKKFDSEMGKNGIRDKHPGSTTLKTRNQKNGGPKETTCEDIK